MKKVLGLIFLVLGIIGIVYSCDFDIYVSSTLNADKIVNLDLLQKKLTFLILSCTSLISGVICLCTESTIDEEEEEEEIEEEEIV